MQFLISLNANLHNYLYHFHITRWWENMYQNLILSGRIRQSPCEAGEWGSCLSESKNESGGQRKVSKAIVLLSKDTEKKLSGMRGVLTGLSKTKMILKNDFLKRLFESHSITIYRVLWKNWSQNFYKLTIVSHKL